MNNEMCNLSSFFPKCFICYKALTLSHCNLPYQYEYQFGSKNFISDSCPLWNDCSMYKSLYKWGYEEAATYRLAWDQRMERDWLQRSANIIRVTVVWLWHQRSNLSWLGWIYPCRNEFNICWETNESDHRVSAMYAWTFEVWLWSKHNACPDIWSLLAE